MTTPPELPIAIADAFRAIADFPSVSAIEAPTYENEHWLLSATFVVNLPSRSAVDGKSATGVRSREQVTFVFLPEYPLAGPVPLLRPDFPSDLPHINPHRRGEPVPPCVYQGRLNDLLHTNGIESVLDQVILWLTNAAAGQLIDPQQGWESTRRGDVKSAFEFDADELALSLPKSGNFRLVPSKIGVLGKDIFAKLLPNEEEGDIFTSEVASVSGAGQGRLFSGDMPVIVAIAPEVSGARVVFDKYAADTVVNLETLSQRATDLGVNGNDLVEKIQSIQRQSNMLVTTARGAWPWPTDLLVGVILAAARPVHLIGTTRSVEFIPYVVRLHQNNAGVDPEKSTTTVEPAFHVHRISPSLLARTSGRPDTSLLHRIVMLGCGSVGSKISLHLARCGYGRQVVCDSDPLTPHNLARHALVGGGHSSKALLMAYTLASLGHEEVYPLDGDALTNLTGDLAKFNELVPADARMIIDSTASPQVFAALNHVQHLKGRSTRVVRAVLYNRGNAAAIFLEGKSRNPRADDLLAEFFELCRRDSQTRQAVHGDSGAPDLAELMVGDNCRSLTMPMADSTLSRAAACMAMQVEEWMQGELPLHGQLCIGRVDQSNIGFLWSRYDVEAPMVFPASAADSWEVRVGAVVVKELAAESAAWHPNETGGALLGHVDTIARTITIVAQIAAPTDSERAPERFVLGRSGLQEALRQANIDSLGYLHFIGTWHSHPMGGSHSSLDINTLADISKFVPGLPIVSLVWTNDGIHCRVDIAN